ncbi:glutathione S-transferase [Rhizoclosmatium globosum]|uniref:Glutathione S-transferase n=1 Tax=Rhizoclosmatium globosum TaxID=329046 RepID=A0A1Y2BFG3_9FUNG|nr:glutathione S-transferase [Rhizoclosmatium globosum]|eukprot:ORY33554.1 glutathione S-transferase [Rhizoclosmatium globosum]
MTVTDSIPVSEITYFWHNGCPYVHRSSIVLHEKGLWDKIEKKHIDLKNKPEWYLQLYPIGKVPAIQIKDTFLPESAIIAEFFIENFEGVGPELLPSNPLVRAKIRLFIQQFQDAISPAFKYARGPVDDEALAVVTKFVTTVQNSLTALTLSDDGPFLLGSKFSLAEVITAPFALRLSLALEKKGVALPDSDKFARFHEWFNAVTTRESVLETFLGKEAYLAQIN